MAAEPQEVVLEEGSPLGPAGARVWVNDPADAKPAPRKQPTPKKTDDK